MMDYDKLTNAEKIEVFKLGYSLYASFKQSHDTYHNFEDFLKAIREQAKIVAKEIG